MKILKTFAVLMLGAFAMSASAANTAAATIQFASSNRQATIFLYENASESQLSDYIAPIAGDYVITAYAYVGTNKYQTYKQASLNNLKIYFKANKKQTSYTLSFSEVLGNIVLKRSDVDTTIVAGNSTTYEFTCNTEDEIEFTVNPVVAYTRDVTANDWGTICLPKASSALEGATFYKSLGEVDAEKGVALEEVSALEAGKPYVFNATAAQIKVTYAAGEAAEDTIQAGNMVGSFYGCAVPEGMYLIVDNQLYKAADGSNTIAANRAYFDVANMQPYQAAPGRRVVFFGGKTTPTNVAEVAAPAMKEGKMILNGQMVIVRDGKMFNAQGAAL